MTDDSNSKPTIRRAEDDPLAYDTRRPFRAVARQMAEDALAGWRDDVVDAELEAVRKRYRWPDAISDAEDMLSDIEAVDEQLCGKMTSWRRSSVLRLHADGFDPAWIAESYGLDLGDVLAVIAEASKDSS